MALSPGTHLGPYEIASAIGAGGMGEVYRARDTRLRRDVAIKGLPDAFLADSDRVSRFEREAQVLASLNHPNIAAIYGLEESGSSRFLVLELVEGDTLADRLRAGPIRHPQAIDIARQVAEALEAAHDKGVIHRDLKPSNIVLTPRGRVKVLDFGLAKLLQAPEPEAVSTAPPAATRSGVVLGTTDYMSPEQAQGLPVDKRTDVWAFGCVLFEMLTGRVPFPGRTVYETLVAILDTEPDWSALPPGIPPRLQWLVRRCLAKDVRRRLHDIADARLELEDAVDDRSEPVSSSPSRAVRGLGRPLVPWLAAGAALVGLLVVLALDRARTPAQDMPVYRASIVLPGGLRFDAQPAGRFALSPDGRRLALVASDAGGPTMLWVRRLDEAAAQPLPGTEGAAFPFWSPDSRSIGFLAQGRLRRVDADGGEPVTLHDRAFQANGSWNGDDVILFTPTGDSPLHRISASGGTPTQVTTLDTGRGDSQHVYPFFLPDGRRFLFLVRGSTSGGVSDPRAVYVGSLDPAEPPRLLVEGGSNAKYGDGHLVFLRESALMAQELDLDRMELVGEAWYLAADNAQTVSGSITGAGAGAFSVGGGGVMAYQTGVNQVVSELVWYDREGAQLGTLGDRGDYSDLALSPDGSRLAVSLLDPSRGTTDLWIYDIERGVRDRFTSEDGDEFAPSWTPDGERLAFSTRQGTSVDLHMRSASGVDPPEVLLEAGLGRFKADWAPGAQALVFVAGGGAIQRSDLWLLPMDGSREAVPFLASPEVETHVHFSPDGNWVVYSAGGAINDLDVYVTPFPGPGPRWRVSPDGGAWPRWSRSGDEIFYVGPGDQLMAVAVATRGSELTVGGARSLFQLRPRPYARLDAYPYDVTGDGQRFLVNTLVEASPPGPVTIVVNWPAARRR